jgi:hypothetical protein
MDTWLLWKVRMNSIEQEKMLEVMRLCNQKIEEQKRHESSAGYGEDYTDGRIVGGAALARRILVILQSIQI